METRNRIAWALMAALVALALALLLGCAGFPLPVDRDSVALMNQIAGDYPNEIGACLQGSDIEIPHTRWANRTQLAPSPCSEGVVVWWHAHPEELLYEPTRDFKRWSQQYWPDGWDDQPAARKLCYLSGPDIKAVIAASRRHETLRYAVVGVRPGVYCWWTVEEVRAAGAGRMFLPPQPEHVSWRDDD